MEREQGLIASTAAPQATTKGVRFEDFIESNVLVLQATSAVIAWAGARAKEAKDKNKTAKNIFFMAIY